MKPLPRSAWAWGVLASFLLLSPLPLAVSASARGAEPGEPPPAAQPADGSPSKALLATNHAGKNLLDAQRWRKHDAGFARTADTIVCDNGTDAQARRGAVQVVELDQQKPQPILASAWARAENVSGPSDTGFSLYIDLVYRDGTELWARCSNFRTGSHDWQQGRVVIFPEKPVKSVAFNLLLREHSGKAAFREPVLSLLEIPAHGSLFDGEVVVPRGPSVEGFQVRDVAAGSDFVHIRQQALGLRLEQAREARDDASFFEVTLRDTTGKDRAVTLLYTVPVAPAGAVWLDDPRRGQNVEAGREYCRATSFRAGANGRLSLYPLGAVALPGGKKGLGLGLDMAHPAFFRVGYNAGTGELFLAYDLGLTPEAPVARLRFCRFEFPADWGFRAALAAYYRHFPDAFLRRVKKQGLWMPFARISLLKGWEDFGFQFKEGNDETAWDDAHGITTFRYTEPLTWWMPMPRAMPRTLESATEEARRLADRGRREARALFSSGYHDDQRRLVARFRDEPWNHGAVWSMNSMPGISGEDTDFSTKWSPQIRDRFYGPSRRGDLDGEYVDSSEGYVTDELDFRRDHFAAARTPLVFALEGRQPAVFRGLIAFEYVRGIAADVHGMGKLMMANATPGQLCWLSPMLDVMGSETDWNPRGRWRPASDAELLYRRAICKSKPYCFLMNTAFESFSHALVEKYMKRALAYGFFPGFFSHNASEGHYFTRPDLYERDRPLFKRYVPLCKLVAEAGWEPITLARSTDALVHLERFGGPDHFYLTVFNDSPERRTATITLEGRTAAAGRELLSGKPVSWTEGKTSITLEGEDVAVLELRP